MKRRSNGLKVGRDLFVAQMGWTAWFIGITFSVHFIKLIFAMVKGDEISSYYLSGHMSTGIYMLVIGIVAGLAYLHFYVENGVTRKDFFKGGLLASASLSIVIPVIVLIINFVEILLFKVFMGVSFETYEAYEWDGGSGIGALIYHIINGPGIDLDSNWFISTILFILNLFLFYLIGWMIASAFLRSGFWLGLGTILLSYVMITIHSWLWGEEIGGFIAYILPFDNLELPLYGFIIGSLVISALAIWLIRVFTSRMPVKV